MLVLSRKANETIVIGGNVVVMVVEIRAGVVRLGVDAPRDVTIHRGEIQAIIEANEGKPGK